jgi:hypothetical protein
MNVKYLAAAMALVLSPVAAGAVPVATVPSAVSQSENFFDGLMFTWTNETGAAIDRDMSFAGSGLGTDLEQITSR